MTDKKIGADLRPEYKFDYSQAKPNRFVMNAKHRETLRNLQTLMGHVDPDSWFISPALPNRDVLAALDAVEGQDRYLDKHLDRVAQELQAVRAELVKENERLRQLVGTLVLDTRQRLWLQALDHPPTDQCQDDGGECMVCSVRDCPYHEPLHYHHDGCPQCSAKQVEADALRELLLRDWLAASENDKCATCQHPAKNHQPGRCRAHGCGCGQFVAQN